MKITKFNWFPSVTCPFFYIAGINRGQNPVKRRVENIKRCKRAFGVLQYKVFNQYGFPLRNSTYTN